MIKWDCVVGDKRNPVIFEKVRIMLRVTLPDGKTLEFTAPTRVIDVAAAIGAGLARATLAAVVTPVSDGNDASEPQTLDAQSLLPEFGAVVIRLLTSRDAEALDIMRHSAAHLMARAVMRLFPGTQLAFGPTTENGFYYDFSTKTPISEADFPRIEEEMTTLIRQDDPFERIDEPRAAAMEILTGIGQTLKAEHLSESLGENETVSFYKQGEFVDLCRGPHIPSPKVIGAVKILSIAGAYWKGDAANQQLQRLYGTAFFKKEELAAYLTQLEESRKRDHRLLGRQHELFAIDNEVGQGLILWLPKGTIVRRQLEAFLADELTRRGYQLVMTPQIGRIELYQTSGHYPYYAESQFPPIDMGDHPSEQARLVAWKAANLENAGAGSVAEAPVAEKFLLRPMNCPHHIKIYEVKPRSYRDLPLRISEFGTVYRFEQSGELSGMVRVRGFTQDDAHIFCTPEQVADEVRGCIEMTIHVLKTLGFHDYRVRLSFRDPTDQHKYVGDPAAWDAAEAAIERVTREMGLSNVSIGLGEAAFYGPKTDFIIRDCIGREWQLGTVQLDYQLAGPNRFGLSYTGPDNKQHQPVIIHRAPFGSFERFVGILIEHFAAAFPLWLAPEQVRVLIVSDKFEDYARRVEQELRDAGLRVGVDYRSEKIGAKIRDAQLSLVPYMLVVGARETESETVAVRDRIDGDLGSMPIAELVAKLREEIRTRQLRQKPTDE